MQYWSCLHKVNGWPISVPLYKGKGNREECNNYRGISLLSVPGQIYGRILNERMMKITDKSVGAEQGGFRKSKGCVDQIFAVKILVEKYLEKDRQLFAAFMDLEKAYPPRTGPIDVVGGFGPGGWGPMPWGGYLVALVPWAPTLGPTNFARFFSSFSFPSFFPSSHLLLFPCPGESGRGFASGVGGGLAKL